MGKSNAKPVEKCPNTGAHRSHVWSNPDVLGDARPGRLRCPGRAVAHRHEWDLEYPVLQRLDGKRTTLGETGFPWRGPFECRCGMSRWLQDGRAGETRFPNADPLLRIMALSERVKVEGGSALSEEDTAEIQAIADMLIEALRPLIAELQRMAHMALKVVATFLDSLPPEVVAHLVELGKAFGEKPDAVDTISLVDGNGTVIDTRVISPTPVSAANAISLQEDDAYASADQAAYLRGYESHFRERSVW